MVGKRTRAQTLVMASVLTLCWVSVVVTGEVVLPAMAALFTAWAMWDWRAGVRPWRKVKQEGER